MPRRQRIVLLVLAVAVVVIAAIVLGTGGGGDDVDNGTGTPVIVVQGGRPAGGDVRTLRFRKGSTIAFDVRSDTAGEVHFHGYDIAKDVEAGGRARFTAKAKLDGRFEVEMEDTGTQIATIEVIP